MEGKLFSGDQKGLEVDLKFIAVQQLFRTETTAVAGSNARGVAMHIDYGSHVILFRIGKGNQRQKKT